MTLTHSADGINLWHADARRVSEFIEPDSVDLIVTSPPYFALRSYTDGGEHYDGQIGSEPTPGEFIDALIECTADWLKVLKPGGSIWVNLGDKYAGSGGHNNSNISRPSRASQFPLPDGSKGWGEREGRGGKERETHDTATRRSAPDRYNQASDGIPAKSLMGLPWRYALRCIDELGLILRAEIIWSKPNGLPESVTDRVRRSHEQWFWLQQSGSEVVEAGAQDVPLCSLCGCPVDPVSAAPVAGLHEPDAGVEALDLSDEELSNERVELEASGGAQHERAVGSSGATVPLLVEGDVGLDEDGSDLGEDALVAVVDGAAHVGSGAVAAVAHVDAALAVDDPSEPRSVCSCCHPLIVSDEPWMPTSLVKDLMDAVAAGELDPAMAAQYLNGDYPTTHGVWFHLTRQGRYFAAVDEVREEHLSEPKAGALAMAGQHTIRPAGPNSGVYNPLGKLPGSVWTIPSEPLTVPDHLGVDHFAAFPTEWPRRIILGWSPNGICLECGEGRRPVVTKETTQIGPAAPHANGAHEGGDRRTASALQDVSITGYACACPTPDAPTRPAVVLDPFGGTGTVALVARALGRHAHHVDLSNDYLRLAQWRIWHDDNAFRKASERSGIKVPQPPAHDGQMSLLDGAA